MSQIFRFLTHKHEKKIAGICVKQIFLLKSFMTRGVIVFHVFTNELNIKEI